MADKNTSLVSRSGSLLAAFKAALRFPAWGGGSSNGLQFPVWNVLSDWWYGSTRGAIDYRLECGDLGGASLVMAAVNWLGRVLPEAPLNIVEVDSEGLEAVLPDHPAAKLWRRPNKFYSGTLLWKAFAYSWIVSGNPYVLKVKNGGNKVSELWYVPPHMMRPLWPDNGREYITGYEYKVDSETQIFKQNEVIHFRDGIDPQNTRLGLSPVASLMREIYTDQEVASYGALLMRNGAIPPVVISVKDTINTIDVDPDRIEEAYQRKTQGTQRGKAWVSTQPVDIQQVGLTPKDLNLQSLRRMPEERLSAVLGIPAIVLGFGAGLENATYSNARQLVEFATETYLVPLYRYIEEELTTQLLPDFEKDTERFKFSFDLSQVRALSEDQDALYARLTTAYQGGWLRRSEVRELAGYEWEPEDEIYASVPTEGDEPVEDDEDNDNQDSSPVDDDSNMLEDEDEDKGVNIEQKQDDPDAVGSDAVLDAAVPWLLDLGEIEAAAMVQAKRKLAIVRE